MPYAVVITNLLDLRAKPDHDAERASQLLLGEPVRVVSLRKGFARICQVDGYEGWVDQRFLAESGAATFRQWRSHVNAVVSSARATLFADKSGRSVGPYFALYGTQVKAMNGGDGFSSIALPRLGKLFVKSVHLRPISRRTGDKPTGVRILAEGRRFLGTPYLWGGISPLGFDCSGLVRALFGAHGKYLPRDTRQQIKVGRKVDRNGIRTGDLLFFDRHVGLAVGPTRVLHASRGGGGVRINSLVPGEPDYRSDLDRDFTQARRLL